MATIKRKCKQYKMTEINFVKEMYNKVSLRTIANKLGVTRNAISCLLVRLNLKKTKQEKKSLTEIVRSWSAEQNNILRQNYGTKTAKEIGVLIGKSYLAVATQARRLKLTKTKQEICLLAKRIARKKVMPKRPNYKAPIKHVLKNLGKVKNYNGVLYIKTMLKWELYTRFLWELEYGEIPKTHCIAIIDATKDVSLENIKLVSKKDFFMSKHNPNPEKRKKTIEANRKSRLFQRHIGIENKGK